MRQNSLPPGNRVNVSLLERTLKPSNLTNSYKLYWFAAILDEIEDNNNEVSFRKLVDRMVSKCWYSILKFKLSLGHKDMLYKIVQYLTHEYDLSAESSENEILSRLNDLNDDYYDKELNMLTRYVPYRFISPFYSSKLIGLEDGKRNSIIEILNKNDYNCIYIVNSKKSHITLNYNWYNYIYNNLTIIKGWYKYNLIKYLQRRNPNVPNIIGKIEPPVSRDLVVANKFWREVNKLVELKDIYTGRPIVESEMSIDHFIPWSFVLHDMFWNLCPVLKATNSQKGDRLPDIEKHLEPFVNLHYTIIPHLGQVKNSNCFYEDYITIGIDESSLMNLSKKQYKDMLSKKLLPLYQLALNNGFDVWQ